MVSAPRSPYVLGMLFYRFISENLTAYINEGERRAGTPDFDHATLSDRQAEFGRNETVAEKSFYILPSEHLSHALLLTAGTVRRSSGCSPSSAPSSSASSA